jgi:hypothetical protein
MKTIEPLVKHDTEDLVQKLESLLEMAKKGEIINFASIYFSTQGEPHMTVSYRERDRYRVVGLLTILTNELASKFEIIT